MLRKRRKIYIFSDDSNRSKLHSLRNYEQIKFGKFLLRFNSEHSVFPFPT